MEKPKLSGGLAEQAVHTKLNCLLKSFRTKELDLRTITIEVEIVRQGIYQRARQNPLSAREQEILELIAQELTTQEIADKLFLSQKTVESHRYSLLQKLDVKNTAGLIRTAVQRGLID